MQARQEELPNSTSKTPRKSGRQASRDRDLSLHSEMYRDKNMMRKFKTFTLRPTVIAYQNQRQQALGVKLLLCLRLH